MLHGTLWDKIPRFAVPVAATAILSQLFNAADIAVIGNFTGELRTVAVAAVGTNSSIISLIVNLFIGIALGANVTIAHAIGEKNDTMVHHAVHTSIVVAVLGGLIAAVIAELFAVPLLNQLNVPDDVFPLALLYLRIYLAGLPVILLYNFEAAVFRSVGETKIPLIALTASGGMSSGSALYVGSTLFMDVLVRLIRSVLIPMTYAFAAVSTAECAAGDGRLSQLRECIGWFIRLALKGIVAMFTAYLAITGLASGSVDAAAVKAAGSALGAAVPVVGGMLSDAAGSILAGANFLKTTAGVFGMLALAAIGLMPFLQIGVHYLVLKLTAAVGGTVASGAHAKLLENLSSAMGYMLAMTGSSILMAMISCCCFMKAVNV